jgi:hypothetical protein
MKTLLLAGALALGLITNADARSHISHSHVTHSRSYDESGLVTHNHYTNVSGHDVHSPSKTLNGRAPSGASAKCGDGSYSFSEHHQGTCSHHGGVTSFLQ